jgi:uncharacterized protein (DUF927 family)
VRTTPNSLVIHAYFFDDEEIEFDVSARDLKTQSRVDELSTFVDEVGRTIGRELLISP